MKTFRDISIHCPYCGEMVELELDMTAGMRQQYFEDCPVCCRSIEIIAKLDLKGRVHLRIKSDEESEQLFL